MSIGQVIALAVLGIMAVTFIAAIWVRSRRQDARKRTEPSRHRGEFQSQRGRVYPKNVTNHNASPSDGL